MAIDRFGGCTKRTDKADRVAAIGKAINAVVSVVMSRTQAITWLWVISDALFEGAIFGLEATQQILNELYQKIF